MATDLDWKEIHFHRVPSYGWFPGRMRNTSSHWCSDSTVIRPRLLGAAAASASPIANDAPPKLLRPDTRHHGVSRPRSPGNAALRIKVGAKPVALNCCGQI